MMIGRYGATGPMNPPRPAVPLHGLPTNACSGHRNSGGQQDQGDSPIPATQHVTAAITISGQQDIAITSHDRGSGSYVSVITGLVMVTMFDLAAARTYTGAWLAPHLLDLAQLLPSDGSTHWRNQPDAASARPVPTAADGAALSIQAHGSDDVKRNFDRNRQVMLVRVGLSCGPSLTRRPTGP